ncbi:MAG: T9SS type A sorting domain-containing protein [Bacteroidia bacterium]|nr:T9SS type A sorting domain-containing protein [Bacteroidia bacterium]
MQYTFKIYKVTFWLFIIISNISLANAQKGCIDSEATNYNSQAKFNDGSCIYPVTQKNPALIAKLNAVITESSGLVLTDNILWTHNDSGNPSSIYNIDTVDGHTIQTVIIDNYPNNDWEDITADSNYIYIGDHGNNNGTRTNLKILKIPKSAISNSQTVHVNAEAISFSYSDQTSFVSSSNHNFDCEALISIKDSLYIFTKDHGDLKTKVYKVSKNPGQYTLTAYTAFNVNGLITSADYQPDTKELILIGYKNGHTYPFLWYFNDFKNDSFFSGNKRRIEIGNSSDWQTEGIAWSGTDRILISCETSGANPASIYNSNKSFNQLSVKNIFKQNDINIYPNPANQNIEIENLAQEWNYSICNLNGVIMITGTINPDSRVIDIKNFDSGIYLITLSTNTGESQTIKFEKI